MRTLTLILAFSLLTGFQLIKTQMTLTVRNELGNTEAGVTVQLYEQEDDYKAEKNPSASGTTDEKGVVRFKDLKPVSYFILARKGDKDNAGGGEQTGELAAKRMNKVTVVIQ